MSNNNDYRFQELVDYLDKYSINTAYDARTVREMLTLQSTPSKPQQIKSNIKH